MLRDWWPGVIPIVAAGLSPLLIDYVQSKDVSEFDQWLIGGLIVLFSVGGHTLVLYLQGEAQATREKRRRVQEVMDQITDDASSGGHPLDSSGDLAIRMNMMIPYRRILWCYKIAYDHPARCKPGRDVTLHFYASSRNSKGRSSLWVGWRSGQGAVGQLWAEGNHVAVTPLPEPPHFGELNMTENQIRYTSDTRCLISVAITEGIGIDLQRKGILNVSSSNPHAVGEWLPNGQPNADAIAYLVSLAERIVEQGLLPK